MKKSILILCACAAFAGCSEDDLVVKKPAIPGSEVQFGATAYMSNGNSTRTEYGDAVGNQIELRWVKDDKIDIACPQAAEGRRKAAYEIVETTIVGDENSIDNSQATKLEKLGAYGIQWGKPGVHHFYAIYPSSESFKEAERGRIGLDAEGLNGYLPVNQNPVGEPTVIDGVKVLKPDMRYAFMVTEPASYDSSVEGGEGVKLTFKPLVTALEFQIAGPVISGSNTTASSNITITEVSIYSASGADICGNFQYKFADGSLTDTNESGKGYSRITMSMSGSGVTLNKDTKMDFTFFVLPTAATIPSKDLKLQIFYTYNGSPNVKTLVIGKDIVAKKKYFFKKITLPSINNEVKGSAWFSALASNIYLSQISIPVAGNAFSSYYKDTSTDSDTNNDEKYYKEQSLHYTELWNKGVRGFEFCTSIGYEANKYGISRPTGTLENEYFVCNGGEMKTGDAANVTFGKAFKTLVSLLDNPNFKNECLVIICTYKSYDGDSGKLFAHGYDPQTYITDLEKFLEDNKRILTTETEFDKLVRLSPNSTVKDLRGKIAILIRPGDDANQSTQNLSVKNSKLTLIKDWGTAVDKWDKRFGPDYKSEGAFTNTTAKNTIEDYLWGVGSSSTGTYSHSDYGPDFQEGYPTVNNFSFDHNTNITDLSVHVQEWARIIPENSFATSKFYSRLTTGHAGGHDTYLWLQWPVSYQQKQDMIKETVRLSMLTKGGSKDNKIFINSLCGFYPVESISTSFYPYNGKYQYTCQGTHSSSNGYSPSFSLDKAGAGGDFEACAADLNSWFYNWLTTENTQQGPVGLVMLNHIGTKADDHSLDLVHWIMMNNFKFPLATNINEDLVDTGKDDEIAGDGGPE